MHIRIAHSLSHYILNTFILIGHRNEPHPPLNCRMGGISGYYFHAFGIIVWIGLWLASKLYLFTFVWRNHLLNKSCSPAHARIRSIFGVENHKSSSEFCLVVTGHICFCSLVWELIEIWVKLLLWALNCEARLTLTQTESIFSIWIDSGLWCLVLNEPRD